MMKTLGKFRSTLKISKEVIKLIWQTSKAYTIYVIILLILTSIIPILEAYFIKRIIDILTFSLQSKIEFNSVFLYLALFIAATLFERIIASQRNAIQIILGNLFNKKINQKIVEKTTKLAFWRFEDPKFHDKLDRTRDQATWKPLNTFYYLFESLMNFFTLVSILIVFFTFSPLISILMIIFTIPSLIVQLKYGEKWFNLLYDETPESRKLNYYQYLMAGHYETKDIKLLNLRNFLLIKYKTLYNKLFEEQKSLIVKRYILEFMGFILSDIMLVVFYFYLAWQTFLQKLSIGDFTFFSTLYTRANMSLQGLIRGIAGVYENNLFINELIEFLNLEEEKLSLKHEKIPKIIKTIEFRDVWFKYPGTEECVLKGISFIISAEQNVALVGENGAGKTTIVKLLTKLYDPTKGEILMNNINIEKFDLNEYRNLIGVAFQDFAKFFFSVEENIKFGDINRKISKEEIIEVAKKAHIHKKIMTFPNKYSTTLGRWYHEGHEISYGEWQRIAIARALIKRCPVYVLDEPTAALDAKAEYLVFEEFKKHVIGKIAMFISHRFSNVRLANKILVLENGKIIQEGSHQELAKINGRYKELYEFQARSYRE